MTTTTQQQQIAAILDRLIDREILANASWLVTELAQDESGRWIDDLAPCLDRPDLSVLEDGFDTEREAVRAAWDDAGDEPPRIEALQHWIVSEWLADKLEANGALVARDVLGFDIWGRTDCGQSLTYNSDLQVVARQMARK